MEMASAQWWSELEMEDLTILGQCNSKLAEATAEQLEALKSNFVDTSLTGYPRNVKLPETVNCHLRVGLSGRYLGYEWPPSKSSARNWFSSNSGQQPWVFTSPSRSVPNSQQKLQRQLHENYFTNFFKPKADEKSKHPRSCNDPSRNPSIQTELLDVHSCNSDTSFNVCWRQLFQTRHGPSDIRISSITTGNGLANKASSQNQDHTMAERKRRDTVNQRFTALSSIIPELNKKDKASILGEAIKYVQRLQDRIKVLEERQKKTVHSVLYMKKTELSADDQDTDKAISYSPINSSSESKNCHSSDKAVTGVLTPEIEIREVNRNVIIRIHCEKKKSLLVKSFAELEKLQLTVVNASILSFSETTVDLTVNAQMEKGCDLTVKDIVKALQALLNEMT